MRKRSTETLRLTHIGAILALLAAFAAVAWRDVAQARASSTEVERMRDRISWLENLRADLYRADGGLRHAGDPQATSARDTALRALARTLEPGAAPPGGLPSADATDQAPLQQSLQQLRQWIQARAVDPAARLARGAALTDIAIDSQQRALARLRAGVAAQDRQARSSLLALLLTLTVLTLYILIKLRDLTLSRKAAYALLQGSETRYRQIVETAHEGICLTDADGKVAFVNRRMTEMLGCGEPELLGRPVEQWLDTDAGPAVSELLRHDAEHAAPARDLRYRRHDGGRAWVMVGCRMLRDEQGGAAGALLMATDITERKLAEQALCVAHAELENRVALRTAELVDANTQLRAEIEVRKAAEQALARSEERLQEIISMMPLALFIKDADSRILLMNEACEEQWGMRFADLSGTRADDGFPPEQIEQLLANDRAAFAGRRQVVVEEVIRNARSGEQRLVQTFKKPIFDADGAPLMLLAMGVDITERTRNEEALRQSFLQLRELSDHLETIKEEERKRIALDIHDDLGQNLMALKIDISMLHARTGEQHPRLNRQVGRVLGTIDATIRSVRAIINDLHPSTLELGLCAAVEWLLRQFERRGSIRYRLLVPDERANASLDPRQTLAIFRIIQESLVNIVRHACASEVEVSLTLSPGRVTVLITDNGIGMQPGDFGKATSYGLKSIKARIDAFGGELTIDSRRDGGTALSIVMPVAAAPLEAVAEPERWPD